jgi:hypothetical protein
MSKKVTGGEDDDRNDYHHRTEDEYHHYHTIEDPLYDNLNPSYDMPRSNLNVTLKILNIYLPIFVLLDENGAAASNDVIYEVLKNTAQGGKDETSSTSESTGEYEGSKASLFPLDLHSFDKPVLLVFRFIFLGEDDPSHTRAF